MLHDIEEKKTLSRYQRVIQFFAIGILLSISVGLMMQPASAEPVQFNTSIAGDRNVGQYFTWTAQNVSGSYASTTYHYTVYDWKEIGTYYDWYSPKWGQWMRKAAEPGYRYIAVWVRGWSEGETYFGYGQDFFKAWIWGNLTMPADLVHMQDVEIGTGTIRIIGYKNEYQYSTVQKPIVYEADFLYADENPMVFDYQDRLAWNYYESTGRRLPAVIRQVENVMATSERGQLTRERFGWKDENELERMEPGWSTRYDGYLLYQIPENARPEYISIAGNFRNYGTAVWSLTEREIDQDSAERYQAAQGALMSLEIDMGVRMSDRPPGRTEA
jgi:hypothetical protein